MFDFSDVNYWFSSYFVDFLDIRLQLCQSLLILQNHLIEFLIKIISCSFFKAKEVLTCLSSKGSSAGLRSDLIKWLLYGFKMSHLCFNFKCIISCLTLRNLGFKISNLDDKFSIPSSESLILFHGLFHPVLIRHALESLQVLP